MRDFFKAGDKIRFKIGNHGVRLNGALDLVLAYYGSENVIYTWKSRGPKPTGGEALIRRERFDEECELLPALFEAGAAYRYTNYDATGGLVYECVFADDVAAVLAHEDRRVMRLHTSRLHWAEVRA